MHFDTIFYLFKKLLGLNEILDVQSYQQKRSVKKFKLWVEQILRDPKLFDELKKSPSRLHKTFRSEAIPIYQYFLKKETPDHARMRLTFEGQPHHDGVLYLRKNTTKLEVTITEEEHYPDSREEEIDRIKNRISKKKQNTHYDEKTILIVGYLKKYIPDLPPLKEINEDLGPFKGIVLVPRDL